MPRKRRTAKRKFDAYAEAAAWSDVWETGYDFFGDAADFCGLTEPINVHPPEARPAAEAAWRAASDAAWARSGHLFTGRQRRVD